MHIHLNNQPAMKYQSTEMCGFVITKQSQFSIQLMEETNFSCNDIVVSILAKQSIVLY